MRILETAFPGVPLRYKRIDLNEPIKKDVLPLLEAERLGRPLPSFPARLLYVLFHRLDTGAFMKAILNAEKRTVVYAKELPKEVQVRSEDLFRDSQLRRTNRARWIQTKSRPSKNCV